MAIAQAVANSFKKEILEGIHDLESGGDTFKLALYTTVQQTYQLQQHLLQQVEKLEIVVNIHQVEVC